MLTSSNKPATFVITGIPEHRISSQLRNTLAALTPAGIVLFSRNINDVPELLETTSALRGVLGPTALIAVDQEGGRVARLRAPFTEWPPMRRFGEANSAALARAAGRAMGRELAAAGFNCDFAPVLDVDSNPANPVIGDRSFGPRPGVVARLGIAFARGLEEAGILPCGKHFPGHGDTDLDSHLALPEVRRTLRQLRRVELAPFRRAIAAKLPLLMTAHVRYTALDPDLPATLSKRILRGLLRRELGFRGAIVSDDLSMHALDGVGSIGDIAVAAFQAGCDLLLACQSLEAGREAAAALTRAIRSGRIPESRVVDAQRRVAAIRRWLARRPAPRESLDDVLRSGEGARVLERLARRLDERTTSTGDARASRAPRRPRAAASRRAPA
ncbi:MAG TPA: beta-N-acetylhexosaminidase [Candidatus Binatia bacterium]